MSIDKTVLQMAVLRVIFGSLSLLFAFLMIKYNDIKTALKLNAILGSIGPFIFIGVSALGLFNLASKIQPSKIIMIVAGVILILLGTK